MNDTPSPVNVPMSLVCSLGAHVKLHCSHMLAEYSERQAGSSMIFVADMNLGFVTGTGVQAQRPEEGSCWAQVSVMLARVGVQIVGSEQVLELEMEGDFVDLLDMIHGCNKVDSRS